MQPNVFPISVLQVFCDRIYFEGCADEQNTLLTGTPDDLRKEIGLLIETAVLKTEG